MKRFDELSHAELIALTDDQIERLIELEIAYAGIIPEPEPEFIPINEPDIKPTIQAFKIHSIILVDQNEAIALSKMDVRYEDYDYNIGDKYKTLKKPDEFDNRGVKPVQFYNPDDLEKIKVQLKEVKRNKAINEERRSKYRKYQDRIAKIQEEVWGKIHEAREFEADLCRAGEVYKKHQELAEGNEAIAKKFFADAYKGRPDIIEALMPELMQKEEEVADVTKSTDE